MSIINNNYKSDTVSVLPQKVITSCMIPAHLRHSLGTINGSIHSYYLLLHLSFFYIFFLLHQNLMVSNRMAGYRGEETKGTIAHSLGTPLIAIICHDSSSLHISVTIIAANCPDNSPESPEVKSSCGCSVLI